MEGALIFDSSNIKGAFDSSNIEGALIFDSSNIKGAMNY